MSQGKGDTQRPLSVPRDTFARNYTRTFPKKASRATQERERELANNYAEHGRRLRRSAMLQRPLDGTLANNNGQQAVG